MTGILHVVATPIGNLGDLSPRAAETLLRVSAVVAEDTRRTRQLFAHLGRPAPPLLALPAFDEQGRLGPILARLAANEEVALCTDAGTPAVSDPGQKLVDAAWRSGARVVPVPGPCAAVVALTASGLPSDRFLVLGFLARKGKGRQEALTLLRGLACTAVIYEAGNRTGETLAELAAALGARPAAVARELTKLHEEIARGTLPELARRFEGGARGEVTLVVGGAEPGAEPPGRGSALAGGEPEPAESLADELRRRHAAGEKPSAIAREVARVRGLLRAEVYLALERLRRPSS